MPGKMAGEGIENWEERRSIGMVHEDTGSAWEGKGDMGIVHGEVNFHDEAGYNPLDA